MYAIVDVETTGGNPRRERITEIAIYVHDGIRVVDSFISLVNPEKPIPYFITRLTGITDAMVANAPRFCEIARKIVEITEGNIFVAHNVHFDYGFVREEFLRLGYDFRRPKLCTVSLSRRLLPDLKSYSLGNVCEKTNITIDYRHRAAGDAMATVKLFELLLQLYGKSDGSNKIGLLVPEHSLVKNLPETAGVYYFHNTEGKIIYIGKSLNIKERVKTHLMHCSNRRALEMKNATASVGYEETGSELIALLLESEEIKKHMPVYNRRQRRQLAHYGLFAEKNASGYLALIIKNTRFGMAPLTTYPALKDAQQHLFSLTEKYQLCQKINGLYQSKGSCFQYSIGECHGACIGAETTNAYNQRVEQAIRNLEPLRGNMFIIEPGRHPNERSVVKVENGKYIGFGYFDPSWIDGNPSLLHEVIKTHEDNRDVQQIIRSYLRSGKPEKVVWYQENELKESESY